MVVIAAASRTLPGAVGRGVPLARVKPSKTSVEAFDGFAHERVVEVQRARLLVAAGQVACEHGAGNVTVAQIVERAGVSRRTFYEIFSDGEDCLLAAFDDALGRVRERMIGVWRAPGVGWRDRVRGALVALLGFFDEQPLVGRLLVVESLSAGRVALERRACVLDALTGAIDEGRTHAKMGMSPSPLSAEGVLGGVLGILYARMTERDGGPDRRLLELVGALMSMIVLPYQGATVAKRELARALPSGLVQRAERPSSSSSSSAPWSSSVLVGADPFKGAGMRLTYRTMRVLEAISKTPGSSNKQVSVLAGASDQGQISKLLARLERCGLICNTLPADSSGSGLPNAWVLTQTGEQVMSSIHQASPTATTGGSER
jgi:AcrR family transcriptional regulator